MIAHFAGLAALGTRGRDNSFPPCPHYGGARSVRTIASGHRFAVLRAAADAASRLRLLKVLRSKVIRYATCEMSYHSADQVK